MLGGQDTSPLVSHACPSENGDNKGDCSVGLTEERAGNEEATWLWACTE